MKKLRILFTVFCICVGLNMYGRQMDSIRVSLLTCAPGTEIYSLFGHTAIRYENYTQGVDWVYNYGMFSFNTPYFVYRFVKGETDYQLGVIPYPCFEAEYAMRGSSVYQQVLNLTDEEKFRLISALQENYLPQNRIYRYNYFYDNCTTRARDQIERAVDGEVIYPQQKGGKTFRGIVHEFTGNSSWNEFGIDLCLGREADLPIDKRLQMFSPFYMRYYAASAYILGKDGGSRPLVLHEEKIVDAVPVSEDAVFPFSPMACGIAFLMICVLLGWFQCRRGYIWWGWHTLLFAVQGIAGCVIAFLFFFSVHPTVGSNWLLLLFNPIPLFYLPVMIYKGIRRRKDLYHWVNIVYLTLFIVIIPLCGQKINLTVLPLALGLLVSSAAYILVWKKRK